MQDCHLRIAEPLLSHVGQDIESPLVLLGQYQGRNMMNYPLVFLMHVDYRKINSQSHTISSEPAPSQVLPVGDLHLLAVQLPQKLEIQAQGVGVPVLSPEEDLEGQQGDRLGAEQHHDIRAVQGSQGLLVLGGEVLERDLLQLLLYLGLLDGQLDVEVEADVQHDVDLGLEHVLHLLPQEILAVLVGL